jgi:hypothetical protein
VPLEEPVEPRELRRPDERGLLGGQAAEAFLQAGIRYCRILVRRLKGVCMVCLFLCVW